MKTVTLLLVSLAVALAQTQADDSAPVFVAANPSLPHYPEGNDDPFVPGDSIKLGSAGELPISSSPYVPLQNKRVYRVAEGPWGDLEYYVIHLQAPLSWLPHLEIPSDRTVWSFSERDPHEIVSRLTEAGIVTVDGAPWAEMGEFHQVPDEQGVNFIPTPEFLLSISPEARSALAEILYRNDLNQSYREAVVIESGNAVEWYREAGLDEELVQRIASLCYLRGQSLLFSDTAFILSTLDTLDEQRNFIRATTRTRSLVLRLNIGDGDEFKEIAEYWTAGHGKKAIIPILEAVSETPGVERLDIAHLLPPTPRKLMYTYPDLRAFLTIGDRDCHWTSLNFFRSEPDGVMQGKVMSEWIRENYDEVSEGLQYGDVIMLKELGKDTAIHSATFIAGDIVFTKNGKQRLSPWILMRYSDMERRYRLDKELSAAVFRLKPQN